MTNLPVIKQMADILGLLLRGLFILYDSIGIGNIALCVVTVVCLIKLLTAAGSYNESFFRYIAPKFQPYLRTIVNKYENKKSNSVCKQMLNTDKHMFLSQYNIATKGGCLKMVLNICIIFALYGIIITPEQYVPELATLTEAQMASVNNFFGLNITEAPGFEFSPKLIFPILVGLSNLCQTLVVSQFSKAANGGKVQGGIMNAVSIGMLFFFSANYPLILSIYWITSSFIDITRNIFIKIYVSNTSIDKLKEKTFRKINKSRVKRGLEIIESYWDVKPTETAAANT